MCGFDMTKTDKFRHVGFVMVASLLSKLIRSAGVLVCVFFSIHGLCALIGWHTSLEVMIMRYVPNASEDFLAELDRNEPARNRFYALSQQDQQRIIERARSIKDVYEMRTLVNSIRA